MNIQTSLTAFLKAVGCPATVMNRCVAVGWMRLKLQQCSQTPAQGWDNM